MQDLQPGGLLSAATDSLKRGDLAACLRRTEAVLADSPADCDALYLKAVTLRYMRRLRDAEEIANRLLDVVPDLGRAWQELGHILRAQGRAEDACWAYTAAVQANPALEAAWRALQAIHAAAGRSAPAREAARQLAWIEALPRELAAVENFIAERRLHKAEQLCRAFLKVNPTYVEAMRQLAAIGAAMNVLDDAETLLRIALEIAPDNAHVHGDYVNVLSRRQNYAEAVRQAERLASRDLDNVAWQVMLANARVGAGDFEGAIAAYDHVLALWPQAESVHLSRGHALKTIGRYSAAVAAYRAAAAARPSFGDAYWSLANLKTYRFTDAEIAALERWQGAPRVAETDRIHFHFALGKAYEDRADYTGAFGQYTRGNAMKLARGGYDPDQFDREVETMIAATPRALFVEASGGSPARDPIFIVGLPRAGSTLIEQILSSHSMVDGTAELPNVLAQAHALSAHRSAEAAGGYPHNLATLSADEFTRMGEAYIADTRLHRGGGRFFTDKMPNNFRHIGLIARMLPQVRIIDARRQAMACCFSGFKQLFAEGQEFSYGLEEIGRYYRGYERLMTHWEEVLPGRILTVKHEDMLDDLESQVSRLLAFLELPFESGCLRFHETDRAVRTASSEQVRRPIDRSRVDQWRFFEPHLGRLKAALASEGAAPARVGDEQQVQ